MNKKGLSRKLICSEFYENDTRDYPTIMKFREENATHCQLVTEIPYDVLGFKPGRVNAETYLSRLGNGPTNCIDRTA
jgi:hypothetical protein